MRHQFDTMIQFLPNMATILSIFSPSHEMASNNIRWKNDFIKVTQQDPRAIIISRNNSNMIPKSVTHN